MGILDIQRIIIIYQMSQSHLNCLQKIMWRVGDQHQYQSNIFYLAIFQTLGYSLFTTQIQHAFFDCNFNQVGLIKDLKMLRSALLISFIFSLLLISHLSDMYSRLKTGILLSVCFTVGVFFLLIPEFYLNAVGLVLCSLHTFSTPTIIYSLLKEQFSINARSNMIAALFIIKCIASLAYLIKIQYTDILIKVILAVSGVISILTFLYCEETLTILIQNQSTQTVLTSLNRLAVINNKQMIEIEQIQYLLKDYIVREYSLISMISNMRYQTITTVFVFLIWFLSLLSANHALLIEKSSVLFQSFVKIIQILFLLLFNLFNFQRKKPLNYIFFLIVLLSANLIITGYFEQIRFLKTLINLVLPSLFTVANYLVTLLMIQTYPAGTSCTGLGFVRIWSYLGIPLCLQQNKATPILLCSLGVLSLVPLLFLEDTINKQEQLDVFE